MKFTQNLARAAMLLLLAVLTSLGARADEAEDLSTPLTLEATTDGTTVTFTLEASVVTNPVEYRTRDGTEWSTWATYTSEEGISLNTGDKVQFRGDNWAYGYYDWSTPTYSNIRCDQNCYVYGNIMSLVKKEGFAEAVKLTKTDCFYKLFYENSHIINHDTKQLMLPATTLTNYCYEEMFYGCSGLTKAPALPATNLTEGCYYYMFAYCYSLAEAPALPATKLTSYCYDAMFEYCTNLTEAPVLPAPKLAYVSYQYMFYGCSSLKGVTCLATNISAYDCTYDWLDDVASEGTFIMAEGMDKWQEGSSYGIPSGWKSTTPMGMTPLTLEATKDGTTTVTFTLDDTAVTDGSVEYRINDGDWTTYTSGTAIELSKGDIVQFRGDNEAYAWDGSSNIQCDKDCYVYGNVMSLISNDFAFLKELPEDYAFWGLFNGNEHIINHEQKQLVLPATTLSYDCYGHMFEGCTGLTVAPALPATSLAEYCYYAMFKGCTGLTEAPALPATTLEYECYYEMFSGCTSLTVAPVLPAATLAEECYFKMFYGCTSLSSVTCYATDIDADDCTDGWLYGVASTGTFNKALSMEDWDIDSPNGIPEGWTQDKSINTVPLTFQARAAGATVSYSNNYDDMQYRTYDSGEETWTDWRDYSSSITLENVGDEVQFRMENEYGPNGSSFSCTAGCYVYGNVMSLVKAEDFATEKELSQSYTFCELFYENEYIDIHPDYDLVLPATTLSDDCYYEMFYKCTGLTKTPDLPATKLAYECYSEMFYGCTGLTDKVPELPATELAEDCYEFMFQNCTNLTKAPALPATEMTQYCYYEMFYGCTSLEEAPALPATKLANECYYSMFAYCTSLTKAPALPATTLAYGCYYYMLGDCTSLEEAPALPATELADYCYEYMFYDCTKLKKAPALPATELADYCYYEMFYGCTSLEEAPALPATELTKYCYEYMFYGCTSLKEAPALPATTLAPYCYYGMFCYCESLEKAPVLPAKKLAYECYKYMFYGCENLHKIVCFATDLSASDCTDDWVYDVADKGVFYMVRGMKDAWEAQGASDSDDGIPVGWKVIECDTYDVNDMAADSYSTQYYGQDVTLASADPDLQFFTVTSIGTTEVGLTEITGKAVPANTPFLIYNANEEDAKSFTLMSADYSSLSADEVAELDAVSDDWRLFTVTETVDPDDHFKGTAEEKEFDEDAMAEKNFYVLNGHDFYRVLSPGTVAAHRCWLELEPEAAARSLRIVIGETATAIDHSPLTIDHSDGDIYDLSGRKMVHGTSSNGTSNGTLRKGIYVKNGRKVVR